LGNIKKGGQPTKVKDNQGDKCQFAESVKASKNMAGLKPAFLIPRPPCHVAAAPVNAKAEGRQATAQATQSF
jgi:hypothetical protein